MRDSGPPLSERRFLIWIAIAVGVSVLVLVVFVVLFHHVVPK
jgi:hypothetical protein